MDKKKAHNKKANQLRLENIMANCIGTEHYYTNPVLCYRYTDGVKTFAIEAGAYWFLSELNPFIYKLKRFSSFKLKVKDNRGEILIDDQPKKKIPFTDCPDGEWEFFFEPEANLLMWNMEY